VAFLKGMTGQRVENSKEPATFLRWQGLKFASS
jgi:hypothetical protein